MDWESFGIGYVVGWAVTSVVFVVAHLLWCRKWRCSSVESDVDDSLAAFARQAASEGKRVAERMYADALEPIQHKCRAGGSKSLRKAVL